MYNERKMFYTARGRRGRDDENFLQAESSK